MKTRDIKQAIENRITSAGQAIENSVRKLFDAGREIDRFAGVGHIAEQTGMSLTDIEDAIGQYLRLVKGPPGAGVAHEWLMFEGFRYVRRPDDEPDDDNFAIEDHTEPQQALAARLVTSRRINAARMRRIDLLERQLKVAMDEISVELPADIEEFLDYFEDERPALKGWAGELLTKYRSNQ